MATSKRDQIHIIKKFIEWITENGNDSLSDDLVQQYADEVLIECNSAIGHGPGHQSISQCIVTGEHTFHYSDMDHEWTDADIGEQTWTKRYGPDAGKVFRLAFSRDW